MAYSQTPKDAGGLPISAVYIPNSGWAALQGLANSTADNSSNLSTALAIGHSGATITSLASTATTTNGNTADLSVGQYIELAIDVNLTANQGTAPTIQFFLDRKGADGIYYPAWQSSSQTTTGQVSTSVGAGCATNQAFGTIVRLRWTIGGSATPGWTFSYSIIGK